MVVAQPFSIGSLPNHQVGNLISMQQDPRQLRVQRRQVARRRKARARITLGVCLAVVCVGGVGAYALARTRDVAPKVQSFAPAPTPAAQDAVAAAAVATSPPAVETAPAPVVAPPVKPASAGSDAVTKAAVQFPDAPSVKPTSISQLSPKHKYVAITIDDGGGFQPEMLALLQKYDARCTTFVLGDWAASNPSTLKKLDKAGFEIANHTWDHKALTRLDAPAQRQELLRTQKAISAVTGNQAPYMRPPGGATNSRVKSVSADLGYKQIMWNRSFGDSGRGATTEKLYENVVTSNGGIKPGDIILCHWGSKASYEAMKVILPELKARGFEFVTISELIADSEGNKTTKKK
jgi:peptidoglycan/xylan/chitin deacetylase (PgdA/CDA1 family)